METQKTDRFNTRWTVEERRLFERASRLAGYKTLSDFVSNSLRDRARKIIEEHERILASERDREIFFDAVMNPKAPNKALKNAVKAYDKTLGKYGSGNNTVQ